MRRVTAVPVAVIVALLIGGTALAQRQRDGGFWNPFRGYQESANPPYDGRFTFARVKYTVGPGGYYYQRGVPAWAHGEPFAGENLMKILDAVTLMEPHVEQGVVVSLTDPELFKYPVAYMVEAGYWVLEEGEAEALRAYLLKGGFLILDDFRDPPMGGGGWDNFAYNMGHVFPDAEFLPMDVTHPVFHSFFEIESFDIVPQAYDQPRPGFYGLFEDNDRTKRLMAIANYNTDIADFWEFSGRGYFPIDEANEAYKLGVNYVMYGLMH